MLGPTLSAFSSIPCAQDRLTDRKFLSPCSKIPRPSSIEHLPVAGQTIQTMIGARSSESSDLVRGFGAWHLYPPLLAAPRAPSLGKLPPQLLTPPLEIPRFHPSSVTRPSILARRGRARTYEARRPGSCQTLARGPHHAAPRNGVPAPFQRSTSQLLKARAPISSQACNRACA